MAHIYCIVNNINGKKYIGKTNKTIKERFKEHISDSRKERNKNRALYRAFNKYGIQNFTVYELEECDWSIASEREIHYISVHGTFTNGYNETAGGDGATRVDYEKAMETYFEYCNIPLASEKLGINTVTLKNILIGAGIQPITYHNQANPVICIDLIKAKQYILESLIGASKRIYINTRGRHIINYNREEMNILTGISSHLRRVMDTPKTSYGCMWMKSSIYEASRYLRYIQMDIKEPTRIKLEGKLITVDITGLQEIGIDK